MKINRREFLKKAAGLGMAAYGLSPGGPFQTWESEQTIESPDLVVVKNGTPAQMVRKAVEALGGMSHFVKKGDVVVVKPNIGWDRMPEQAADTNPEVVAEVIRLCREAGASKVKVFDRTCNEARRCYRRSGIQKAAEETGAEVRHVYEKRFKSVTISQGELLKSWEFYLDALTADVLINVPIAKVHSMCRLTMGIKNLMGVLGGNRGQIHNKFAQKIVDINTVLQPHLTILDAVRILVNNGPQGGNLADVRQANTIVAGVDRVAVDSFGATLFGLKASDLDYIRVAHERGLGEMDLSKLRIEDIDLK